MNNSVSFNQSFSPGIITTTFIILILIKVFAEEKIIKKNLFDISLIFSICSIFINIFVNIIFIFPLFSLSSNTDINFGSAVKEALSFGVISVILYLLSYLLLIISWIGLLISIDIFKLKFKKNKTNAKVDNVDNIIKED